MHALNDVKHEIILVDNNSADKSVEITHAKSPSAIIVKNNKNLGYARANNQAIRRARGQYVLLLNPDTVVEAQSIKKMIKFADDHQEIGILGCLVTNPGDRLQWDSCGHFLTPWMLFLRETGLEKVFSYNRFFGKRLKRYWPRNTTQLIDWVSGVCMLIRKTTLDEIGLLDERFFAYMEDVDICRRAMRQAWKTSFFHNAKIFHNLSKSWKNRSNRQLHISLTSERKYLKKYYGLSGVFFFMLFHFIGSYLKCLTNICLSKKQRGKDHFTILRWLLTGAL
jgi:GT2 family glycosyltransferase